MTDTILSADGRTLPLRYFVSWRPWLWQAPVARALHFMGDLRGKRLLEIGGGPGRMSALFALMGAEVTLADVRALPDAEAEMARWGVSDRVKIMHTAQDLSTLAGQKFDLVFTKSVLWCIKHLEEFLATISTLLVDGGRCAFVENFRGGLLLDAIRNLVHSGFTHKRNYYGIRKDQLPIFRRQFDGVDIRRHLWLVYSVLGYKKASAGSGGATGTP